MMKRLVVWGIALAIGVSGSAFAAGDYACEVMTLKGQAFVSNKLESKKLLTEGSLLKVGDTLDVEEKSYVDVAYDKRWNNITRITGPTKIHINSIFPIGLSMDRGNVLALLSRLPKNSTFEIETPTAVAAVRGSEFRTVCEGQKTDIYNLSDSKVEVFGKEPDGDMAKDSVELDKHEKTSVDELGREPEAPEKMTENEIRENESESSSLTQEVKEVLDEGRVANVQEVEVVEKEYSEGLEDRIENLKDETKQEHGEDRETKEGIESDAPEFEDSLADVDKELDKIDESNQEDTEIKSDDLGDPDKEKEEKGTEGEGGGHTISQGS